jgi:hypothetical protein
MIISVFNWPVGVLGLCAAITHGRQRKNNAQLIDTPKLSRRCKRLGLLPRQVQHAELDCA